MTTDGHKCADMISYYPAEEKPCEDYDTLADACFDDFQNGEGCINMPYLDCQGHLTVAIGTLLYHKRTGESEFLRQGEDRFGMCGFSAEQKQAAIKATELLKPRDYMNIRGEERKTITKRDGNDTYTIVVEKIKHAGAKIVSVQKNNERPVMMPQLSEDRCRHVFNKTFKKYYDYAKDCVRNLHNLPETLQCSIMHQIYARGSLPGGLNIRTIEDALQLCTDSIARRQDTVGVSAAELQQIERARQVVSETLENARNGRVIPKKTKTYRKNRQKFDEQVDRRNENNRRNRIRQPDIPRQQHVEVPDKTYVYQNPVYRCYQMRQTSR